MIKDCIKEGFTLANRNLQLVVIRIVVTLINLFAMLIFMGVPLVAIIAYLGIDLANAEELFPHLISNPLEFISRYFGAVLIAGISFVFYLAIVSLINLYVAGGTIGVLRSAVSSSDYRFSLSLFFKESGTHFTRLLWLLSLLLFVFSLALIILGIAGGAGFIAAQSLKSSESFIGIFLSSFLTVTATVISILVFIAGFMYTFYSMIISVMEERGAVESIKKTHDLLKSRPQAILLFFILFAGVITINILFFGIKIPFDMIPLLAPFVNLAITIVNSVFQSYVAVFVWSSLIIYYLKVQPVRDFFSNGAKDSVDEPGDYEI
jgi:hypothetical protein